MNQSDDRNLRTLKAAMADDSLRQADRPEQPSCSQEDSRRSELGSCFDELLPTLKLLEAAEKGHHPTPAGQSLECPVDLHREQVGDFQITRVIGRGGMGIVYEAIQQSLGRRVALKMLSSDRLCDRESVRRFEAEARIAARLHHSSIVPIFGVGEDDGIPYYVMQLIDGISLDRLIEKLRDPEFHRLHDRLRMAIVTDSSLRVERQVLVGAVLATEMANNHGTPTDDVSAELLERMTTQLGRSEAANDQSVKLALDSALNDLQSDGQAVPNTLVHELRVIRNVVDLGAQIAEALAYSHARGTSHRDIKPSNLMIDTNGDVWITDFGLATVSNLKAAKKHLSVVGTPRYMAPEQFTGQSDQRSDVYSLGVTLCDLLTLRDEALQDHAGEEATSDAVGHGLHPRHWNPSIPEELDAIIFKATQYDVSRRYRCAAEMAADLRSFLAPESAAPAIAPSRRRSAKPKRLLIAAMLAGIVLTVTTASVHEFPSFQSHGPSDHAEVPDESADAITVIEQTGAVPYQIDETGDVQILLVRNRSDSHWTIPKATQTAVKSSIETAAEEAFEEAGVIGQTNPRCLGTYHYQRNNRCYRVRVWPVSVEQVCNEWPENFRQRAWFPRRQAADCVTSDGLRSILRRFHPVNW